MRLTSMVALAVALVAAGFMLWGKPPTPPATSAAAGAPAAPADLTLDKAFAGKVPVTLKGAATPLFFFDEQRWLGSATASDGASRLVFITPGGERELRRLPKAETPEFAGFAVQGTHLVWLELTNTADGAAQTQLWTIDDDAARPRLITADTGDVALFDRSDDVVIHDGQVSWLAAARTDTPVTEIRTVSLKGGKVKVRNKTGAYSIATWPWLTSVNLGQDGPVELFNVDTGKKVVVNVQANELMACSPVWCRSVIIGSTAASTVIEVLKPDGSQRFRVATGNVAASTVDVGLLDRYEVYSYGSGKLVLYDLADRRMITVAKSISQTSARGPMLWWSTGDNETIAWHVIDLRTLVKS